MAVPVRPRNTPEVEITMCYLLDGLSLKVRSRPMAVPVRPRNTPEVEITKNENP